MIDLKVLVPVLSKIAGRDLTEDFQGFFRARAAVGAALGPEEQKFFIENWRKLPEFMETAEGREAVATFLTAWQVASLEKELTQG